MSNTKDNTTTIASNKGTIADSSYPDLFGLTPRELERRIQRAKEWLADVRDINDLLARQAGIAQWIDWKRQIEERARAEGKI